MLIQKSRGDKSSVLIQKSRGDKSSPREAKVKISSLGGQVLT